VRPVLAGVVRAVLAGVVRPALVGAVLLALAGCATPWDPPGLRPYAAVLAARPGHRLFDATPYVWPARGELVEFFCRWPTDRPVPIHLPDDATPDEARALDAALAAWESAGLGLRFERVPLERARIDVAFVAPERTTRAEGTGYTLADCRLDDPGAEATAGERLPARMARARVRIVRRETAEWDAADHAFFAGEVAGVALHELAHALGFQGHAKLGGGILAGDTRHATAVGRRVLAGEPFDEPTLRALYALPSGLVLARHPVAAARTAALDERLAAQDGTQGPWVRVGDRSARVFWRDAGGQERGVTLPSLVTVRAHPERLVLLPD
jgi:hypothetical protein